MTIPDSTVAIIGGGIAGLTSALAFAQKGARVFVFEQAEEYSEVGAGIQITPNAGRVLQALGVFEALLARGVVSDAVEPFDGLSGRNLARFDLRRQSPRYLFIHRAALLEVLLNACHDVGVTLRSGVKVETVEVEQGQLIGETYDLVVFADGVHSVGRGILGNADKPFFTGQAAWRAIVAGEMDAVAHIAMGPGKHLVMYPIGKNQINVVAVQEQADWAADGWDHVDDPVALKNAFSDYSPFYKDLLASVKVVRKWGLHRYSAAETWSKGRAVLIGDAAHPTLPFLAQGANLAIEDAYALARRTSELSIEAGLSGFQRERQPRVERAIATANANAGNYHARGLRRLVSHQVLKLIGRVAPNAFINRLSWLYEFDITE